MRRSIDEPAVSSPDEPGAGGTRTAARRALSLVPPLAAFWLLLSGHYTALLLVLGLLSVVVVTWLVCRMVAADGVDVALRPSLRAPLYAAWLVGQILTSSLAVLRQVLSPRLAPRPAVGPTPTDGLSETATVAYANSITLTPGTLSLQVDDASIEVHALRESDLEDLRAGGMRERLRHLERR